MFFCMLAYRRDARSNQPARKVRQTLYRLLDYVTSRMKAAANLIGQSQNPTMPGQIDGEVIWPVFVPGERFIRSGPCSIKPRSASNDPGVMQSRDKIARPRRSSGRVSSPSVMRAFGASPSLALNSSAGPSGHPPTPDAAAAVRKSASKTLVV